jgi:hypothetical protein
LIAAFLEGAFFGGTFVEGAFAEGAFAGPPRVPSSLASQPSSA